MLHGQEIYTFFNKYGQKGLVGIVLAISLIGYIIYKTLKIILNNKIKNYQEFIISIVPQKVSDNKILIFTINNIINIFLLISFNIMVAGFATYFLQELNISKWYGVGIISFLSFITFSKNIEGVIKINTYLMPTLIILIVFLGIKKIDNISYINSIENSKSFYWLLSSVLYASYNSITLIPILVSLKKYINTKKEARINFIFYNGYNAYIISYNVFINEYIF